MSTPNQYWLLSHPSQFGLAKKIEKASKNIIFKDVIHWDKFENNYPNLFIKNARDLIGKHIIFLAGMHEPATMFEQLSVIYTLPRSLVESLTLLLPFFPCGTMEKVEKEGQIATAKTMASLLSNIPITKNGPTEIIIYDIHALQGQFYFGDNVVPRLESCVLLLHEQIDALKALGEKVAIVFPDDGASKRYHRFFYTKDIRTANRADYAQEVDEIIFCSKVRLEGGLVETISQEICKDTHLIIVDDLINTGNSILESAKICCDKGASKISVFTIHGVFPNDCWKQFLSTLKSHKCDTVFENFWITDSIPHAAEICEKSGGIFKLVSLAKIFAQLF